MTNQSNTQAAEVAVIPRVWRNTLRKLAFMAGTSGGTAGPDQGLKDALKEAMDLLDGPYRYADAAQPTPEPVAQAGDLPKGFLSDVLTAAGMVRHGKQCKALADRLGDAYMRIRGADAPAAPSPVAQAEGKDDAPPDGKRWFYCTTPVTSVSGWQQWRVAAASLDEAKVIFDTDGGDFVDEELEVQNFDAPKWREGERE